MTTTPRNTNVFTVNGAKMKPNATTVARSVMKQAAKTTLPYAVAFNPNSSITAYTTATDVVDMATPASQLASGCQPSSHRAAAAQPRNGATKLTNPIAQASFHCLRKTTGPSSAPARKVSKIAPAPERNCIHPKSPARTELPR